MSGYDDATLSQASSERAACRASEPDGCCASCAPEPQFVIIAEGIPWKDSEGRTAWPWHEIAALAEVVEHQGYDPVQVRPA